MCSVGAALLCAGCVVANPDWLPLEESTTRSETDATSLETSATGNVGSTGTSSTGGGSLSATASGSSVDPSDSTTLTPEDLESPDPECLGPSFPVVVTPPDLMFVVDKSYSMFELTWDGEEGEETRWAGVWSGLEELMINLEFEALTGLVLSPQLKPQPNTWGVCTVDMNAPEVELTSNPYMPVMAAIPPKKPDVVLEYAAAGNPLAPAIARAREHLTIQPAVNWSQFIIVITDGAPNCSPADMEQDPHVGLTTADDDVVNIVQIARVEDDIFTVVIGVDIVPELPELLPDWEPSSDPIPLLTEIAEAGGLTGPDDIGFRNAEDYDELKQALTAVERFADCLFPVPEGLLDALGVDSFDDVMLDVAGGEYLRVDDCVEEDGFVIIDGFKHDFIGLCNAACDDGFQEPDAVTAVACEP